MSVLCRNRSIFSNQSPIVGHLGYQQGLTLCSQGGWGGHSGGGRKAWRREGTRAWLRPTVQCHFLGGPFPRFQALGGITVRGGPSPPLSSRLPVPGGSSGACCRGRHHLRLAGVPGPLPNLGAANTGPIVGPREPGGQLRPDCHLCAPGRRERPGAARGGAAGTRPRRAPFKRCQGLIDEKWSRAGANLSPEAAGRRAGARGGARLLSGSAAVEGHYRGGLPRVFQPGGGVRVERERAQGERWWARGRGGEPQLLCRTQSLLLSSVTSLIVGD